MASGAGEGFRKRKASQVLESPRGSVRRSTTPGASGSAVTSPSTPLPTTQAEHSSTSVLPFRNVATEDQSGTNETPIQTQHDRPSKTYSKAFRLRGIPKSFKAKEIIETFHEVVGSDTGVNVRSLASDPFRPDKKIATLEFSNIPDTVCAAAAKDGWHLEAGPPKAGGMMGRKHQMVMDSHFHGFTPLHSLEDDKCKFDIVAISGLGGHAFGSFKQRGGNFMWLRDGLPYDIDGARVFIYGYDTQLAGSTSFKSIKDIGSNLLTDIKKIRSSTDPKNQRPLMFIGHSLGGIVIKEAIIQMSEDRSDQDLLRSIRGILFFGVPNQGMDIQSLIPMVGDQPNRYLLETLNRASERLDIQANQFQDIFATHCPEIISFFETVMSPTAENKHGVWQMTGPPAVLVDRASAVYTGYRGSNGQNLYGVDQTHSEMVKFSSRYDSTYEAVVLHLKKLKESTDRIKSPLQELSADQSDCLRSLAITEQIRRLDQIAPANDTCDWLVKHELYLKWLSQPRGMLWIKGKPGSGKSSLMKHTLGVLERLYAEEGALIASFFVYGQGEQMQKSLQGLLHSLLHQLYSGCPNLPAFEALTGVFRRRNEAIGLHGRKWTWSTRELEDTLKSVLEQASQSRPLIILVDALDELNLEAAEYVIDSFQSILGHLEGSSSLRICFACRHYPTLALNECLKISVEEGNDGDIQTVVEQKLQNMPNRHVLVASIVEKANGIFQWADLVASHIRRQRLKGIPSERLEKEIEDFPGSLHDLYSNLLQESSEDRVQTIRLLQWICFAERPLSMAELRDAVIMDADISSSSIEDYMTAQKFGHSDGEIELRLRHLSKGLVEFSRMKDIRGLYSSDCTVGYFIHQSVSDYLLSRGFGELDPYLVTQCVERGNLQLTKTCVHCFNLVEVGNAIQEALMVPQAHKSEDLLRKACPLLPYTLRYWTSHGKSAEVLDDGPDALLKVFVWLAEPDDSRRKVIQGLETDSEESSGLICSTVGRILFAWSMVHDHELPRSLYHKDGLQPQLLDRLFRMKTFSLHQLGCEFASHWDINTMVQFLAFAGMWRTLNFLRQQKNLDLGSDSWSYAALAPILIAVESGDLDTVNFLVDLPEVHMDCKENVEFHPDGTLLPAVSRGYYYYPYGPLHLAASRGYYEILDTILRNRQDIDPDQRNSTGSTPFMMARNLNIARRLLETKRVDVLAINEDGVTALHNAARFGRSALCEFLLDTCKLSPTAKDKHGRTPLLDAIHYSHSEPLEAVKIAKMLLAHPEVDPDVKDEMGRTPLSYVMDVFCMKFLLSDTRVDPDSRDINGQSVLSHKIRRETDETVEFVRLLLDTGKVDVNAGTTAWIADYPSADRLVGYTPLHFAALSGSLEIVKLLLDTEGIDPDIRSCQGRTPLYLAASKGRSDVVHALLGTRKVDPDSSDPESSDAHDRRSPLFYIPTVF